MTFVIIQSCAASSEAKTNPGFRSKMVDSANVRRSKGVAKPRRDNDSKCSDTSFYDTDWLEAPELTNFEDAQGQSAIAAAHGLRLVLQASRIGLK